MTTKDTKMIGGFVVISYGSWGWGATLAEAKKRYTSVGYGRLSGGYTVYEFADDVEFVGVTQMGYIEWIDPQEREPKTTVVKPRGRK